MELEEFEELYEMAKNQLRRAFEQHMSDEEKFTRVQRLLYWQKCIKECEAK